MTAAKENLYLLKDLATKTKRIGDDLPALKQAADWIRDFICQDHPAPARKGRPVCPFVPPAIDRDTLWLAPERVRSRSQLEMSEVIDEYRELFVRMVPRDDP